MKLYMMVEVKGKLSEKEKEDLCWKMLQATDAHSMTARETLEELKEELTTGIHGQARCKE
jgi:hypothetical protein